MKILVVDDGQLAPDSLLRLLCRIAPEHEYISALTAEEALVWLHQSQMEVVFLNLEMPGMDGLTLAHKIQTLQPRSNLVVATEHADYALEALQMFVSGFLLKPVQETEVRSVLSNLRYPPQNDSAKLQIRCFGNFEAFAGGRPLNFKRSKSRELLAYLVDRNGATCTSRELVSVLWENRPETPSQQSHLRNLIFDLTHTLEQAGKAGLLMRGRNTLALDTSRVECDYYDYLEGKTPQGGGYRGEYMQQYPWAELTRAALRRQSSVG